MDGNKAKRVTFGSIIAVIGYLLSPLSWWNDIFINLPLAFGLAIVETWLVGLFTPVSREAFVVFMIFNYWLTNLAGFALMHRGFKIIKSEDGKKHKKEIMSSLLWSAVYTAAIVVIAQFTDLKSLIEKFLSK